MAKLLDITKVAKEIIIDKYNAKSGVHIQYNHVELGQLVALAPGPQKENTKIELLPTVEAPFLNKFHLSYQRMNLVDIFAAPYLFVPANGNTTLHTVLEEINLAVGLNLTVDDVVDAPIETDSGTNIQTVEIVAKPGSVFYIGQTSITFDRTLNTSTVATESNTNIYTLIKNSAGNDYIAANAFDGVKSTNFEFLKNVDSIVTCEIDRIFSCAANLIILSGNFSFVAANLSFIAPGTVYKTVTINRAGFIVSARVEETPLASNTIDYITVDRKKCVYYIADVVNAINVNPKRVYRVFENGTLDGSFNFNELDSQVVKVIPTEEAFFTLSYIGTSYFIKRYTYEGVLDPAFSAVEVKSVSGPFTDIDGFAYIDELGEEIIEMMMANNTYTVAASPDFTAETVDVYKSPVTTDFFSPFFTVSDNGKKVKASGLLARFNNRSTLANSYWRPKLVRNVYGGPVVYGLNSFLYLGYQTIVAMLIGEDKEYAPVVTNIHRAEKVTDLIKIHQVENGYETYALCQLQDRETGVISTGVLSFGPDHTFNGVIVAKYGNTETVADVTVLN